MRAGLILALIFSVVAPPVPWTAPEAPAFGGSRDAASGVVASPVNSICALVRSSAKAEKTYTGDGFATIDRQPQHRASEHAIVRITPTTQPSHLDLDNPPLAPRPPPLV